MPLLQNPAGFLCTGGTSLTPQLTQSPSVRRWSLVITSCAALCSRGQICGRLSRLTLSPPSPLWSQLEQREQPEPKRKAPLRPQLVVARGVLTGVHTAHALSHAARRARLARVRSARLARTHHTPHACAAPVSLTHATHRTPHAPCPSRPRTCAPSPPLTAACMCTGKHSVPQPVPHNLML